MSTVTETPMSHAERARLVLDHIRGIKELIGGFMFAGIPDNRTLNFARTIRDEFFENTEIEPSVRFGTSYLDQTRTWAAKFKAITRGPHASD